MSDDSTNAKPGAGTPGFTQSTWTLVAKTYYRIRIASANAYLPFLPVAFDGAGYIATLFWGAAQ